MNPQRIWWLLGAVLLIPIIPWVLVGAPLEAWVEGALGGADSAAPQAWLAALAGVAALAVDSFLPIPSTLMMSALGFAFGAFWGGVLASVGIFLSGTIAYLCCRRFGVALARRIAGEAGLERVREGMRRLGPLTIAVTRSVPVVQEATACLAGLTEMPARSFFGSLAAGSVPTGFAYAAIGASALQSEGWALALSLVVPALTWPLIYWVLRSARNSPGRV